MYKSLLRLSFSRLKALTNGIRSHPGLSRDNTPLVWKGFFWSIFVTLACDYDCDYCVQKFGFSKGRGDIAKFQSASPDKLLELNKLEKVIEGRIPRAVITGGEPLLYKGLVQFLEGIRIFKQVCIVSNLSRDVEPVIELGLRRRDIKISFIGSYHSEFADFKTFVDKAKKLKDNGMLDYCDFVDLDYARSIRLLDSFERSGIRAYAYPFVGSKDGKVFPRRMRKSCDGKTIRTADCLMAAVLVAPDGRVFNCHAKLYKGRGQICSVDDFSEKFKFGYLRCEDYGLCHPCQGGLSRVENIR